MSPETHLLTSWLIAAHTTSNPRDCRLVTLAGILPDLDGLGLIVDAANWSLRHKQTFFYLDYHHHLLHGAFGALLVSAVLAMFAVELRRVFGLALVVFHLHLLCDFVGARGPSPEDLWPIYYFGPFSNHPVWSWKGQWRLDGWQNRWLTVPMFCAALWLATTRTDSVVGVFNRRADAVFIRVMRKWRAVLNGLVRNWKS